eukprot:GEZU01021204.1.p1 GENE.GEZU01021204.1~~GEZU01021204.1.p1  ORF type:complete len:126 (+),score=21.22 GEZU01021204.1:483-860(+)
MRSRCSSDSMPRMRALPSRASSESSAAPSSPPSAAPSPPACSSCSRTFSLMSSKMAFWVLLSSFAIFFATSRFRSQLIFLGVSVSSGAAPSVAPPSFPVSAASRSGLIVSSMLGGFGGRMMPFFS